MKRILTILLLLGSVAIYAKAPKQKMSKRERAAAERAEILAMATPIASITGDSYPDKDIWILSGVTNDLKGVREALYSAALEDKTIDLTLLNVSNIPSQAFIDCSALARINCPEATTLGRDAFANCNALSTVEMPMLSTIGESAFNSCSTLTDLNLPVVSSIKGSAFLQCDALTTLTLGTDGAGIGDISSSAFDGFSTESCSLIIKSGVVTVSGEVLTIQSSMEVRFLSISDMN